MSSYRVVTTRSGARALLDRGSGEIMHPVGPLVESRRLYVAGSRLVDRLASAGPPLVLFDVGLGAGSNAAAALEVARSSRRALRIISFDRTTEPLELALEQPDAFGIDDDAAGCAAELVARGRVEHGASEWILVKGQLPETLQNTHEQADIVFWDPYSPRANPQLWTVRAFAAMRSRCRPSATLHTYSAATATRAALLLAGFWVGFGQSTGPKKQTTMATVPPAMPDQRLDRRWLDRLARSSAPLPSDAPHDAMARIAAHGQFV